MNEFSFWRDLYHTGGISRREFLGYATVLGASAIALASALGPMARAASPKRGGQLRVGIVDAGTSDTLDPGQYAASHPHLVAFGQLRNCLVEIDHNSKAVPELAESWEPTPDASQWTFTLRKGVEFHNAKTLEAEDVVYSINHHRGEDSTSPLKSVLESIVDIKADGKHTVTFTTSGGNADFPYLMSDSRLQIVPVGTEQFGQGIGTGGYILKSFEPGVHALTARNPNYWKPDRAHFDEVETIAINEVVARTSALQSGEVDAINRCDRKTFDRLGRIPGIQTVKTNGTGHYTMPMRTDTAPFDNNDVRLALKYAIDRESLLKTVLRGHGVLGNDHPISEANQFHASDLPQRVYDPDKAKFHLKKAGLSALSIKLHTSDAAFAGAVDAAILYKEHALKASIDIDVVREPADGYWSSVWMKKPFCFSYWFGRPTEDWMLSTTYAADAAWNETFWKHEHFNELLVQARAELDSAKRREMYGEMQRIVSDEGGVIIPMFASDLMAASEKLHFDEIAANAPLDGYKLPERWWFE